MTRSRHVRATCGALLMVVGVTACAAGAPASTKRQHPQAANLVTFVAPVTCAIDGRIIFTPPLSTSASSRSTAMVTAKLSKCDHDRFGGAMLGTGHLSEALPPVNDCTTLYAVPASSGGTIRWSATSKVTTSVGVSLGGFSGSQVGGNGQSFIHLSSSGGSIESGSFANASGTSLSITSTQNVSTLLGRCAHGLKSAVFSGTISLAQSEAPVTTPLPKAPADAPGVLWSAMTNGLDLVPEAVACPSTTLCVFAGTSTGSHNLAVEASQGPFLSGGRVAGHLVEIPQSVDAGAGSYSETHLSCPSTTLCLLLTPGALYASSSPLTGPWLPELTVTSPDHLRGISCSEIDFCAAVLAHVPDPTSTSPGRISADVMISTKPMGGESTWTRTRITPPDDDVALSAIACPSPRFCVAGGGYGEVGSWIETSTDPTAGSSAWSGGPLDQSTNASGPGQYALLDLGCPTAGFCVGSLEDSQLKVSNNPAGGFQTWQTLPGRYEADGVAWCTSGQCAVADAGTFPSATTESSPVIGDSPLVESCVSLSFCVSIDASGQTVTLQVGRVTTTTAPWPPPIASIARPSAAGRSGAPPPRITVASEYPPTVLQESDLIKGTGPAVKAGDTVTVQYVEAGYANPGKVIQTTWIQAPQKFVVGRGQALMVGEDEGVVGMQVGGRRELIVPPGLAYQGLSDATVVLVVDVLRIR